MPIELQHYFAPQGALSHLLLGYQTREGQQQLAEAVAENIANRGVLLGEAGTGTGKTFAYLLPLLHSGEKALISTATKNLQEQIYTSDLPLVTKLITGRRIALLKGRSNYLCHYHYQRWHNEQTVATAEIKRVEAFCATTRDGDLVNLNIADDSPIRQKITSTIDNCLGRDCEFFEQCYIQRARQAAKAADLIVVNHHLLLADFALRSDGFAEILPEVTAFVIDEAHHLPQLAVNFLGEHLSQRQLKNLCDDLYDAVTDEAHDAQLIIKPLISNIIDSLNKASTLTTNYVGKSHLRQSEEQHIVEDDALNAFNEFWQEMAQLSRHLTALAQEMAQHRERGKLLAKSASKLQEQIQLLDKFIRARENASPTPTVATASAGDEPAPSTEQGADNNRYQAQWLSIMRQSFILHSVPVNAAQQFRRWIANSDASWTFLSATLAVNGKFDHFRRELGLAEADTQTLLLDSPFDYRMQSVLYHPTGLPDPNTNGYTEALIAEALPLLNISQGRAFLLFTSYRALNIAHDTLKHSDFTLFKQGDLPKNKLLQEFRNTPNAVLLATSSFWEGVDVRGDRLVCVIIDKLPFSAPNDPVTKTRHRLLQDKGLPPFIHDTLPQAVITLKQGVGRLIRDSRDYGVLLIGDPRLTQKSYGKVFLDSLPRMTRTRDLNVLQRFFDYHEQPKTE